jgi:hypothetical protein
MGDEFTLKRIDLDGFTVIFIQDEDSVIHDFRNIYTSDQVIIACFQGNKRVRRRRGAQGGFFVKNNFPDSIAACVDVRTSCEQTDRTKY